MATSANLLRPSDAYISFWYYFYSIPSSCFQTLTLLSQLPVTNLGRAAYLLTYSSALKQNKGCYIIFSYKIVKSIIQRSPRNTVNSCVMSLEFIRLFPFIIFYTRFYLLCQIYVLRFLEKYQTLPSIPQAKSLRPHSQGAKERAFIEPSVSKVITSLHWCWLSVQIVTYSINTLKIFIY